MNKLKLGFEQREVILTDARKCWGCNRLLEKGAKALYRRVRNGSPVHTRHWLCEVCVELLEEIPEMDHRNPAPGFVRDEFPMLFKLTEV